MFFGTRLAVLADYKFDGHCIPISAALCDLLGQLDVHEHFDLNGPDKSTAFGFLQFHVSPRCRGVSPISMCSLYLTYTRRLLAIFVSSFKDVYTLLVLMIITGILDAQFGTERFVR